MIIYGYIREDYLKENLIRFEKPCDAYYLRHEENRILRIPVILEKQKAWIDKRTRLKRIKVKITIETV